LFDFCSKSKQHSKKKRDVNGSGSSPAIIEVEEPQEAHAPISSSSSKKSKAPVKFYIDDHEDPDEKQNLIKAPEIVVDPPSDISRFSSPDQEDSKV
jgi:hypothetical protein